MLTAGTRASSRLTAIVVPRDASVASGDCCLVPGNGSAVRVNGASRHVDWSPVPVKTSAVRADWSPCRANTRLGPADWHAVPVDASVVQVDASVVPVDCSVVPGNCSVVRENGASCRVECGAVRTNRRVVPANGSAVRQSASGSPVNGWPGSPHRKHRPRHCAGSAGEMHWRAASCAPTVRLHGGPVRGVAPGARPLAFAVQGTRPRRLATCLRGPEVAHADR